MCVDNAASHDPRNPVNDRRLTMYWIGWVFFGITITSIFIAGIMVSMYKMNIQDTKMRSNDMDGMVYYDDETRPMDYDNVNRSMPGEAGGNLGTRRAFPTRRPYYPRRQLPRGHRGPPRRPIDETVTYRVNTAAAVDVQPLHPAGHDLPPATAGHDLHPPTFVEGETKPTNRSHGLTLLHEDPKPTNRSQGS